MKKILKKAISFLDRYDFISFGKNNKTLIFLYILLTAGMVLGCICVGKVNMDFLNKMDFIFLNDIKIRFENSSVEIFISSLASLFGSFLIIQMAAFSCWGAVIIPMLIIFRGFSLGISSGYLYLIYGLKGVGVYILILLPGIFISSIGLLLLSAQSIQISTKIARKISPKSDTQSLFDDFKIHIKKSSCALFFLLISSGLDIAFTAMFSRFFEF